MKKITLFVCAIMASVALSAQAEKPAASPASELIQTVGLTEVTVVYSRPSVKGRTIFGDLVPFNKIWRTGANARTKITFDKDVTFGGTAVKAGTYAIFTKPSATSWEVYLYTEHDAGGTPQELDESKVAAKVTSQALKMPMSVETFTITIGDLTDTSASFGILWDTTYVPVKLGVGTK